MEVGESEERRTVFPQAIGMAAVESGNDEKKLEMRFQMRRGQNIMSL